MKFIDIDQQKIDSMISVGENDQDDEWATDEPGDDAAFEKRVLHNLGKPQHNPRPQLQRTKTWPHFPNRHIMIRRSEMEIDEQNQRASKDEK